MASCELDKTLYLNAINGYMTELMPRETINQYKLINTTKERIILIQYLTQYAGSSILDAESDIGEQGKGGSLKRKRKSKFVAKAGDKGQMTRVDKISKLNADGRFVKLPKTGRRILSFDDCSDDDNKAEFL
ncbi:LOW QUALITY PROTEIN: hypothetical protein RvY_08281 [Ramazzottius varieornatus]|uniref:Uncharacterized protein n=1 Tax=Ramazzottius varieornatus TaxID=947166 RepID=A0A1D1VA01_RAMVA|nr:LOW QUALITY PROTEIN: hypothetical protein RvY_08281 [Ramazzottius varieornatus]